jgi:hypothetical protein
LIPRELSSEMPRSQETSRLSRANCGSLSVDVPQTVQALLPAGSIQ